METQQKVIIKKKDGNYKTPEYVRNAVKKCEANIKLNFPEKYMKRLERQRENYRKRKERLALEKQTIEVC